MNERLCSICREALTTASDGRCSPCNSSRLKAYRQAHPGVAAASQKAYRQRHPGREEASKKIWRAKNPEKVAGYHKKWRQANAPKFVAYIQKWQAANPDKRKAHDTLNSAVKSGRVVRPDSCSKCGKGCIPHGHHRDYGKPLEVEWLCNRCHVDAHKKVNA